MIQANELRIGNWVDIDAWADGSEIKRGRIDEIKSNEGVFNFSVRPNYTGRFVSLDAKKILPTPLTPEILLACGFYKWKKDDPILTDGGCDYYVNENTMEFGIFWEVDGSTTRLRHVKHLHQLQNLYFALTGAELEYNP